LGYDSKQRFYGGTAGGQVEEELRRLSTLLQSLLKDFVLLKDSVWHLQDERDLVHRHVDSLEKGELASLRTLATESSAKVEDLTNRMELTDIRVKATEEGQDRLRHLLGRVEVLDARLSVTELNGMMPTVPASGGASRPISGGVHRRPRSAAGRAGSAEGGIRPHSAASEVFTDGYDSESLGAPFPQQLPDQPALQGGADARSQAAPHATPAERLEAVDKVFLSIERDAARQLANLLVEDTEPRTQPMDISLPIEESALEREPHSPSGSTLDNFPSTEARAPAALDDSIAQGDFGASIGSSRVSPGHRLRPDDCAASRASDDSSDAAGAPDTNPSRSQSHP